MCYIGGFGVDPHCRVS